MMTNSPSRWPRLLGMKMTARNEPSPSQEAEGRSSVFLPWEEEPREGVANSDVLRGQAGDLTQVTWGSVYHS